MSGLGSQGDFLDVSDDVCLRGHDRSRCLQRVDSDAPWSEDPNCCAPKGMAACRSHEFVRYSRDDGCHGYDDTLFTTCCYRREGLARSEIVLLASLPTAFWCVCVCVFYVLRSRYSTRPKVRPNDVEAPPPRARSATL